jgi:hypothetical protein
MSIIIDDTEHGDEVEDLLHDLLEQLKIMNTHLAAITDEIVTKDDIE